MLALHLRGEREIGQRMARAHHADVATSEQDAAVNVRLEGRQEAEGEVDLSVPGRRSSS